MATNGGVSVWSSDELAIIVCASLDMVQGAPSGQVLPRLLASLPARGPGSVKRKLGNVTYVLESLGLPRVPGYGPLPHVQRALIPVVEQEARARGLL